MRHKVVLPPPRSQARMPIKITPIPTVSQKPDNPKGGFFHGLHIVWVLIIGFLLWQNFSQADDIRELKEQNKAITTWIGEAESYLHKHYR